MFEMGKTIAVEETLETGLTIHIWASLVCAPSKNTLTNTSDVSFQAQRIDSSTIISTNKHKHEIFTWARIDLKRE
jgi:hypothetical protein